MNTDTLPGPAHAVHFATYEAVKQTLGGNKVGEYHFVASGMLLASLTISYFRTNRL